MYNVIIKMKQGLATKEIEYECDDFFYDHNKEMFIIRKKDMNVVMVPRENVEAVFSNKITETKL